MSIGGIGNYGARFVGKKTELTDKSKPVEPEKPTTRVAPLSVQVYVEKEGGGYILARDDGKHDKIILMNRDGTTTEYKWGDISML